MLYQMMCITGEEFPDWLLDWGLQSGAYFHLLDPERRGKLINFNHHEYTGPTIRDILLGEAIRAGAVLRKGDLEGASDLLKKCLRLDPKKRASAREIAEHPWLD
jgi:serine/threonine-protein kinase SRPK3